VDGRCVCSSKCAGSAVRNPACGRKTFAEPLPLLVAPHAQRTRAVQDLLRVLGEVVGGEAGARLSQRLAMACSPDTLLRLVRRARLPASSTVRVLGVDEWAWRKRQSYGNQYLNAGILTMLTAFSFTDLVLFVE
jgi:hypothetical protein